MKRIGNPRYFFGGFFMVLILLLGITGFLLVDRSTQTYGTGLMSPLFSVEQGDALHYTVSWMGNAYTWDLSPVNTGMAWVQQYATALIPAKYLLLWQGNQLVKTAWDYLGEQFEEWQFQQNLQE